MSSLLRSTRPVIVVAAALALPAFAACGGIVVVDQPDGHENPGAQSGVNSASASAPTATATATITPTTPPPDTSAYPCTSTTTEYYKDPSPPPTTGGCKDGASPDKRHATGTVVTIVAPNGVSCLEVQCICEASGHWGPSSEPGCNWGPSF